jgi:epoxyqueuosine reductase
MPAPESAIRARALALGFDIVRFARADEPLERDFDSYQAFVDAGLHGQMSYLALHRDVRRSLDGPGVLAGARSVVCVAVRYATRPDGAATEPEGLLPHIARYARGRDYHAHVRRKLRKLADFLRSVAPGARARPMCDTAPVLERAWAARAGVGFVGKNGMLVSPGLGSYTLLGEVATTLALEPDPPLPVRCGRCMRCLDACPTRAFLAPRVLDARRCVSYLTIEHRGAYDAALARGVGPWLFGCDACQQVCPFNAAPRALRPSGRAFEPLPRWRSLTARALLALDDKGVALVVRSTALRRLAPSDLRRNAEALLANAPLVANAPP